MHYTRPMHQMMPAYHHAVAAAEDTPPGAEPKGNLGCLVVAGGSFLMADAVAKRLPPTAAWALGWGAAATLGTFFFVRGLMPERANAAALGVAGAYLHAYSHQTSFPHKPAWKK